MKDQKPRPAKRKSTSNNLSDCYISKLLILSGTTRQEIKANLELITDKRIDLIKTRERRSKLNKKKTRTPEQILLEALKVYPYMSPKEILGNRFIVEFITNKIANRIK